VALHNAKKRELSSFNRDAGESAQYDISQPFPQRTKLTEFNHSTGVHHNDLVTDSQKRARLHSQVDDGLQSVGHNQQSSALKLVFDRFGDFRIGSAVDQICHGTQWTHL
jgi:hypothetical protein